jgi:adenine phosphoribosyltransferase
MNFNDYIRNIPDFPKEGILFKDITPLLKDKDVFKKAIDTMAENYQDVEIDYVVGIEARGFIIGTPLAYALNKGFIPIRKPGKLPYDKISASYDLEYGSNELEIHTDAIQEGDNILLVDDLLATGGTTRASVDLIEKLGGNIVSIAFLLEIVDLKGRDEIKEYDIYTLLRH